MSSSMISIIYANIYCHSMSFNRSKRIWSSVCFCPRSCLRRRKLQACPRLKPSRCAGRARSIPRARPLPCSRRRLSRTASSATTAAGCARWPPARPGGPPAPPPRRRGRRGISLSQFPATDSRWMDWISSIGMESTISSSALRGSPLASSLLLEILW